MQQQDCELSEQKQTSSRTFSLQYRDLVELGRSYLSFVVGGGLFIPTLELSQLKEDVSLLVELFDQNRQYQVRGKVVWITPIQAQSYRTVGVGVQFVGEDAEELHTQIETLLSQNADSGSFNYAM